MESTKNSKPNLKEMETGLRQLKKETKYFIFEVPEDENRILYWIYPSIHERFGAFTVITVDS